MMTKSKIKTQKIKNDNVRGNKEEMAVE